MKLLGLLLTACCASYRMAAEADDMPGGPPPETAALAELFSGNVQFMTNYVGRGLAQSVGQPSVEGEIDVNSGDGFYGGVDGNSINWVDQLYPGDSVNLEVDGWLGYRMSFGSDWTTKAGFLRLQFPGKYVQQSPPTDQPNTTEAFAYIAWKGLSAQINYAVTPAFATPDSRGAFYANLTATQALDSHWSLSAHLGRKQEPGSSPTSGQPNSIYNYTDYKLSVAYNFGAGVSLTLAHTWTNANLAIYTLGGYAVGGHHTWLLLEKDF